MAGYRDHGFSWFLRSNSAISIHLDMLVATIRFTVLLISIILSCGLAFGGERDRGFLASPSISPSSASLSLNDNVGASAVLNAAGFILTDPSGGIFSVTLSGEVHGNFSDNSVATLPNVAAVQNFLDTVTYTPTENSQVSGSTYTETVTIEISDGTNTTTATLDITITSVADPTVVGGTQVLTVDDNDGPVQPFPALTLTDPDVGDLTVGITLSRADLGTLDGAASFTGSVAATEAYLNGLTFTPAEDALPPGTSGDVTFTLTFTEVGITPDVTDNGTVLTVNSVDDIPTIDTISNVTIAEDAGTFFVPITGVTDGDDNSQTLAISTSVLSGGGLISVLNDSLNAALGPTEGGLRISTQPDAFGTAAVSVTITDVGTNTVSDTFDITITPVNDSTVISGLPIIASTDDDTPIAFLQGSGLGLSDVDNGTIEAAISFTDLAAGDLISGTDTAKAFTFNGPLPSVLSELGALVFLPSGNRTDPGTDEVVDFILVINDGAAISNAGLGNIQLAVTALDSPPTLQPISDTTVLEDFGSFSIPLLGISDGDNGSQTLEQPIVEFVSGDPDLLQLVGAAFSGTTGSATFATNNGLFGGVDVRVTMRQAADTTNLVARTFRIDVLPLNDAPTIGGTQSDSTLFDNEQKTLFTEVTIGDEDPSELLRVTVETDPLTAGVLVANGISGATLTFEGDTAAVNAWVQSLVFAPKENRLNPNDSETVAFNIIIADDSTSISDASTQAVVTAFDDDPTIDLIAPITIPEDTTAQQVPLTGITDGDNGTQSLSLSVAVVGGDASIIGTPSVSPSSGVGTMAADLSFTPQPNQTGTVILGIEAEDGGGNTYTKNLTVIISPENDAPTISGALAGQTTDDATPMLPFPDSIAIEDLDGDFLQLTVTLSPSAGGTLSNSSGFSGTEFNLSGSAAALTTALKGLQFSPAENRLPPNDSEVVTFTISVEDASENAINNLTTVTVTALDSEPEIPEIADITLNEDFGNHTFTVSGISDGDDGSQLATLNPTLAFAGGDNGMLQALAATNNGGGTVAISFESLADANGVQQLQLSVSDGSNTVTEVFSVEVIAQNDAPTIAGQVFTPSILTIESVEIRKSYLDYNDVDDSNNALTLEVLDGTNYSRSGNTVSPLAGYTGNMPVNVRIRDDGGAVSADFVFTVAVLPVPNASPAVSNTTPTANITDQETAQPFTDVTITDPEDDVLTVTINFDGQLGALSGGFTGSNGNFNFTGVPADAQAAIRALVFTPAELSPGVNRTVPFAITITDGEFTVTDNASLVNISPVDGDPVLPNIDDIALDEDFGAYQFTISGLTDGDDGTQTLSIAIDFDGTDNGIIGLLDAQIIGEDAGRISFESLENQFGTQPLAVTLQDDQGNATTQSFTVEVASIQDPPVILSQANNDLVTNPQVPITIRKSDVNFTDVDSDPSSILMIVLPGDNYSFDGNEVTPDTLFNGLLNVRVQLLDLNGSIFSNIFELKVLVVDPENEVPVWLASDPPLIATEEVTYSYDFDADDPDSDVDSLYFFIENKPIWLTFDSLTGLLTGTPTNEQVGVYPNIRVGVTDRVSTPLWLPAFDLEVQNVNDAPEFLSSPATVAKEDSLYDFLPEVRDDDLIHGDVLTFSIVNQPPWASFDPATGRLSGTPAESDVGIYTGVTIFVDDVASDDDVLGPFTIEVLEQNTPPSLSGNAPLSFLFEGESYSFTPNISDPDNDPLFIGIDNQPDWATFDSGTGALTGNPVDGDVGRYENIVIKFTDGKSDTVRYGPFAIEVLPINSAPTLDNIPTPLPITINESERPVQLTGIGVGADDGSQQIIEITAVSSNQAIISNSNLRIEPLVDADNPLVGSEATLFYRPNPNSSGTVNIDVTIRDNGTNNNTVSKSFPVVILAANTPPTIDNPGVISVSEDQDPGPIQLTGISDGNNGNQGIAAITASTLNPNLIQNLSVDYDYSGNATTALLNYELVPNAFDTAVVRINIRDNGGVLGGGDDETVVEFLIVIAPVNDAPIITGQATELSTFEEQPLPLNVTALSIEDVDNVPGDFTLNILSPTSGANYTLEDNIITPMTDFNGMLSIPVEVTDLGGLVSNTFNLSVEVIPVNDRPEVVSQLVDPLVTNEEQDILLNLEDLEVVDPDNVFPDDFSFANIEDGENYSVSGSIITPELNFTGTLTVPISLTDGESFNNISNLFNLRIRVDSVNDAPVITGQTTISVREENELELQFGNLLVSDVDNNYPEGFSLQILPGANYTVSDNAIVPTANFNGTLIVPVRVNDGTAWSNTFNLSVQVLPVNDAPTIAELPDFPTILDGSGVEEFINFSGVGIGPGDTDQSILSVTAESSNTALIKNENIIIDYPGGSTGTLTFTTEPFIDGVAVITITVQDDGGTENGGIDTRSVSFAVTVNAINTPPSFIVNRDVVLAEDAPADPIRIREISDGDDGSQQVSFTATSLNQDLIANVSVDYVPGEPDASINYEPVPGRNGTGIIRLVGRDDGGLENGGLDSTVVNIDVTIRPINDRPVADPIETQTILEDADSVTIQMTGVGDGDPDLVQELTIRAVSENTTVIPGFLVRPTEDSSVWLLKFKPSIDQFGVVTVNVSMQDDGGTQLVGDQDFHEFSFEIVVEPVNDAPTIRLASGNQLNFPEDATQQTIILDGISVGPVNEVTQQISGITPSVKFPERYRPITTRYDQGAIQGSLLITPQPQVNGCDTVTITIFDNGGTENNGVDSTTISFPICITPVNDAPVMDATPNRIPLLKNAGEQCITLTGLADGDPEVEQQLSVAVTSLNEDVVAITQPVEYDPVAGTATFCFEPLPNVRNTAVLRVLLKDDGGTPGVDSLVRLINVEVGLFNNPPVIEDGDRAIEIDVPKDSTVELCINAFDIDQDPIFFAEVIAAPELGTLGSLEPDDLCLTYTPLPAVLPGQDIFEILVCDLIEGEDRGCDTLQVIVNVLPSNTIKVYTGISPSRLDGNNDQWVIEGIENYPDNRVQVYNKTGALVFDAMGYDNDATVWRGDSNTGQSLSENLLPKGIYYYVIDFGIDAMPAQSGAVYIR